MYSSMLEKGAHSASNILRMAITVGFMTGAAVLGTVFLHPSSPGYGEAIGMVAHNPWYAGFLGFTTLLYIRRILFRMDDQKVRYW